MYSKGEGRKEAHLQYVGKEGRKEEGAYPACSRTKEVLDEEERERGLCSPRHCSRTDTAALFVVACDRFPL